MRRRASLRTSRRRDRKMQSQHVYMSGTSGLGALALFPEGSRIKSDLERI